MTASLRKDSLVDMAWIVHKDGNRKLMPTGVALITKKQIIATAAMVTIA